MADLARYRQFHSLFSASFSQEPTPLIMTVGGNADRFLTATAIYLIVTEVFRRAADSIRNESPDGAMILSRASTH